MICYYNHKTDHPDRDMYNTYMTQWLDYKGQMEAKRIDIQERKAQIQKSISQTTLSQSNMVYIYL